MISQFSVYLVTSELDRRVALLQLTTEETARATPGARAALLARQVEQLSATFPGIAESLRESGAVSSYPDGTEPPPSAWPSSRGAVFRDGHYYLWNHRKTATGDITISVPVARLDRFLSFGRVDFGALPGNVLPAAAAPEASLGSVPPSPLPPILRRLDPEVAWFATMPAVDWDRPEGQASRLFVGVRTRPSAVLAALFTRETDFAQGVLAVLLLGVGTLFVIVELISVVIGIRLTRTMTGAVHHLYLGTQRIMQGDFSHRIQVTGDDQLAQLSRSFNHMTENVEHLLTVAKEKERLQSELEIAHEVQDRLFPANVPSMTSVRIRAVCHPARLVSGDYFDYESLGATRVAIAIGDVAGKGISAALLMASLQSSLRAQLAETNETLSTAALVTKINVQLHANTAPEKFATFCFGVFDETTGAFTYTNAGHLPPILVTAGRVERLDVNGTVVGAFAVAGYGESCVELRSGDLLVFFTDGVTEPENAYGEMFGEQRLCELLTRNAARSEEEIIDAVHRAVLDWTGDGEMQDDLTLLVMRRV